MDQLFPYAEAELDGFERTREEFGRRYPRLAGRLAGEGSDPHVQRLIQGVALLNARTARRLHQEYPLYVEALFHVLYPHYLRSFPSCSIARFGEGASAGEIVHTAGRGCSFRLGGQVQPDRAAISSAQFLDGAIRIGIDGGGQPLPSTLRIFLDGEPAFCAALRDSLLLRVSQAVLSAEGRESLLDRTPVRAVGFDAPDALLPQGPRQHEGCRIVSEFFGFPEKFNFLDLDLSAAAGAQEATLDLRLDGAGAGTLLARMLWPLGAEHLLTRCAPVVNLFPMAATPFLVDHGRSHYQVMVNAARPEDFEIYSIDRVRLGPEEYHPFYTRRHDEPGGRYWLERRDPARARATPGYEVSIAFSREPEQRAVATIGLTCSNRDVARSLRPGAALGGAARGVLLRQPTMPHRTPQAAGSHWRLVSHLSLATRSLVREGLEPFLEMLALYDVARSPSSQRQIGAIRALEHRPAVVTLRDRHGTAELHGVEVRLHVDEAALAGCGLHLFAEVMDRFLGLYVHLNSFTRLVLVSAASGEELLRCQPRNGKLQLI
ncbi:type VI secretion system baseplate subunit TssF [Massilia endophytica]|uniref:type VI secretion system baseplate subunit TssF n=1 Tax=Massilia endophytica TaxID=2899220 RepID=UPI001E4BD3E5|nr:type VI secretion system baseplate subunit TssF [Massilia endophytica]UGQ48420.1 type VI secretion system baseplate subunit TssF [Massilia endophytica]